MNNYTKKQAVDDFKIGYIEYIIPIVGLILLLTLQVVPSLTPSFLVPIREYFGKDILSYFLYFTFFVHIFEAAFAFQLATKTSNRNGLCIFKWTFATFLIGFPFLLGLNKANNSFENKKK